MKDARFEDQTSSSCCLAVIMFVIFQGIMFPIMFIVSILYLPIKIVRKIFCCNGPKSFDVDEIDIQIHECESDTPKDELVFIHGFPDDATIWDKQVEFFKKEYRCMVVTLPNFGKENNPNSWGYSFKNLSDIIIKGIKKNMK